MSEDRLYPLGSGSCTIGRFLGNRMDTCISNRIAAVDHSLYTDAFARKLDDGGSWAGEFFGKWYTSAAWAYHYSRGEDLRVILDDAAARLREAQEPDGRLSSYTDDFGDWDVWGRKYALLGLIAHYEQTGARESLEAAGRAAHAILRVAGPDGRKLTETGLAILESLSSSSILEPLALLVRYTGDQKILQFCEYLVSLWSEPNAYNSRGMRLVEDALDRVPSLLISSPKSYEMMSCFEGLCELYRVTSNERYLDAVLRFAERVMETEIMIVGSASSHELWCDRRSRQTEPIERPMETCVTVTWMKLCLQLLRLTGDSRWADQLELSLYNALLGAMQPDGTWWSYFSPLHGSREPSRVQVPLVQSSCCVASGPRGLMTVPLWAVMDSQDGPVVNLYAEGTWRFVPREGVRAELRQQTTYPEDAQVSMTLSMSHPAEYTLSLRIPAWSERTHLEVNGERVGVTPGSYARIRRVWSDGDTVNLTLDLRGRIVATPSAPNQKAVMVGPIVLAADTRFVEAVDASVWLHTDGFRWRNDPGRDLTYALLPPVSQEPQYFDLAPPRRDQNGAWLVYDVPFVKRPNHFFGHSVESLPMCDYLSSGNGFGPESRLRVWLPQPWDLSGGV